MGISMPPHEGNHLPKILHELRKIQNRLAQIEQRLGMLEVAGSAGSPPPTQLDQSRAANDAPQRESPSSREDMGSMGSAG